MDVLVDLALALVSGDEMGDGEHLFEGFGEV